MPLRLAGGFYEDAHPKPFTVAAVDINALQAATLATYNRTGGASLTEFCQPFG
jgi:hypothetical protein